LRGVREIRSRQNVPPKTKIDFAVRCDADTAELLKPMEPYFDSMAGARPTAWGPNVEPPALSANVTLSGIEIFVDLADLIDIEAEIARKQQDIERLEKLIVGKKKKLENENFVDRAPEAVVQKERDGLANLEAQLASVVALLESLKAQQ